MIFYSVKLNLWIFKQTERDIIRLYNSLTPYVRTAVNDSNDYMLNFGYWVKDSNDPVNAQHELSAIFGKFAKFDTVEMIADVGSPALTVHLDTFHMNIEEKDPAAAIRKAGKRLGHFHACGSDRGTPGNDHIDWKSIAAALKKVGYKKEVVIESFTPDVLVIAKAASIWREMEPDKNDIAKKGVRFLKRVLV